MVEAAFRRKTVPRWGPLWTAWRARARAAASVAAAWLAERAPRSLRVRLLGFAALGLIVPTLVSGTALMLVSRRSLLERGLAEQRETAWRLGDRVAAHVGNLKKALLTMDSGGALMDAGRGEQVSALRELMVQYPGLMESALLNAQGRESAKLVRANGRIRTSASLVSRGGRPEFRGAFSRNGYVGPVFFTQRERIPQMFVAVALDRRRGVLLARLSLDDFGDVVREAMEGRPGTAFIVDSKGNLIAHPDRERVLAHENLGGLSVVKEFLSGDAEPAGKLRYHRDEAGRKVLAVHHRVAGLGWGVVVQTPVRDVLAALRSMGRRMALVVSVLAVAFLAVGLSLIRKILEPLQRLQEGAQSVGRGDLRHRLDIRTGDEIQTLAEEFNRMAESLEALEQAKRDLTHMIVHDLKSPLAGVLGSLDYVASGAIGELTPEQKKILGLGTKSGKDLLRLIQNLLDLAKMEEGRLELKHESFSLLEMAAECVDELEAHIHRENKLVSVDVPPSLPKVWADRDLLHRVMTNLLGNALKHTGPGAELALRGVVSADGRDLVISVKDGGEGIPPEFIGKIFEKFGQADAKKRRFRIGSGLGLTFCKLAAEAHGGRIWVESVVGQGSEFFVALPLPPETVGAAAPAEPPLAEARV
jgi:signal transduction histidine kinase